MSHLVSKITIKVFLLVMGMMMAMMVFFTVSSYVNTIDNYEKTEMKLIKSLVKIHAVDLESVDLVYEKPMTSDQEHRLVRNKLERSLFKANSVNNLGNGLSLILIRERDQMTEIISAGKTTDISNADGGAKLLLTTKPGIPLELGMGESLAEESLFYAYPLSLPGIKNYGGYLYINEAISGTLAEARAILLRRFIIAMAMISLLGFVGMKFLRRIFRAEVKAKKLLKEYAELAENKNLELEKLSFVLCRSDNLILMSDQGGKIQWLNQKSNDTNNYSAEELCGFIGKQLEEVSRYPKIKEVISKVSETKQKLSYEAKSFDNNGEEFWASTTVTPILNELGEVENLLFVDADVTKLKKAQSEILKLANFTKENTNAVIRVCLSGKILYANEPGRNLLKQWDTRVNEDLKKSSIRNTIHLSAALDQEQKLNLEFDDRILSLRFFPVKDKNYVNVYAEDITDIKNAEKQYRERASFIEKHNVSITDSINYAKRIQEAIMPGEGHIRKYFEDSFLMYRPKDIVSGDFVWVHELKKEEEYLIALADCTGHGVPGAMMSIIGHSLLKEIVEGEGIYDPACILEALNEAVIETLRQNTEGEAHDGMDVSILRINLSEKTVTFSGAYQDVMWMNGKLNMIKGNRRPIGGIQHKTERKFSNRTFQYTEGDSLFLASDGFVDQFGGPKNKKFLKRRLTELISANCKSGMREQSAVYAKVFEEWKGAGEQVDDVSMIGIRL